jgi:hypothetical protein
MPDLFSYGPRNVRDFVKTNLVAILYTIIIHLLIAIVLVFVKVEGLKQDRELGVMLDFTEEISLEELLEQENIEISPEWIEQVFEAREKASNQAVNINDPVKQEISTEDFVNALLDELEAEKDDEYLKNREKLKEIISSSVYEEEALSEKESEDEEESFTGPTSISYEFLDAPKDRNKRYFEIPVYRCEGSAEVIIDIIVEQDGSVTEAEVISTKTLFDPGCFKDMAETAALSSEFKSDYTAPEKQRARITYQFVAQ